MLPAGFITNAVVSETRKKPNEKVGRPVADRVTSPAATEADPVAVMALAAPVEFALAAQ